ncbi:MAG: YHS domain-containing (seleno)protein [Cyclobacteriaceae bacterium]
MKIIKLTLLICALFVVNFLQAQHKYSCTAEEKAFGGNDLVAYFAGTAQPGVEDFQLEYDGLKLYFANADNLATFQESPEKFMPAYGGWCATAVSSDVYVTPDYNMFKIQDGELFFFEVKAFYNGKTQWEKDPDIHEISATKNYRDKFGTN